MKKLLLYTAFLFAIQINAQNYNYLGTYSSNGTPNYMEAELDIITVETQEMISNALPESFPVPDYNPHYISSGFDTDLNLSANADVWVTFVSEGAGYRNVLGYYTYPVGNPPATVPSAEDITIIFPNVSALGSGGGLLMGNKVKIGTFTSGTAIGWVLLANGWRNGQVTNGYWKLYSNTEYNPESNPSLKHHNVLLADPDNERIILGFEDIRRDYGSCDNDFNDAIFYVTANPYSAMTTTNFADVDSATEDVSSANNGGLESNGNLAGLIAKRNFTRSKTGIAANKKSSQKKYKKSKRSGLKGAAGSLENYLPDSGMYGDETAQISSPQDLISVTNATQIFSVDIYKEERRVSAVLATETEGAVYDHSKAICDRLNNSSLEDVRTVTVRGHNIISSKLIRSTGEKEYTLSFSIKKGATHNQLFSFWNIEQYPAGDYYNFQIWGSSFSQVFAIANHVIDTFSEEKSLTSEMVEDKIPTVFVKSGFYQKGKIHLKIVNKSKSTEAMFNASVASTEISDRSTISEMLSLTGNWNETLTVDTGNLFDLGFSLGTSSSVQKDILYLADGPWGADYNEDFATVKTFEVTNNQIDFDEYMHQVERDISVSGEVKGTINMFRHLLPGDQVLDVSSYNAIQFHMTNAQPVELVLMTDQIADWNDRLRVIIQPNESETLHTISFEDFKDANGNTITLSSLRTLVFSISSDYSTSVPFSIDVKNVILKDGSIAAIESTSLEQVGIKNYPNPFNSSTTLLLKNNTRTVLIKVYDMMGRLIDEKEMKTINGKKAIYEAPQNLKGIFKYMLKDDEGEIHQGTFVIN